MGIGPFGADLYSGGARSYFLSGHNRGTIISNWARLTVARGGAKPAMFFSNPGFGFHQFNMPTIFVGCTGVASFNR